MALINRLVDTLLLSEFPTDRATLTRHVKKWWRPKRPWPIPEWWRRWWTP